MSMPRKTLVDVFKEEGVPIALPSTKHTTQTTQPIIQNTQHETHGSGYAVHSTPPAIHNAQPVSHSVHERAALVTYRRTKAPLNCTIPFELMDLLEDELARRLQVDRKSTKTDIVVDALHHYLTGRG